jgi:hypothetical protein
MEDEKALLRTIVDAGIDLKQLLGDRSFATTDEAAAAIRLLSRAAVELNLPGIVAELGAAAELGTVDPALEGVPDVVPVRKRVLDPTAEVGAEPETVIPFNLEKLRRPCRAPEAARGERARRRAAPAAARGGDAVAPPARPAGREEQGPPDLDVGVAPGAREEAQGGRAEARARGAQV